VEKRHIKFMGRLTDSGVHGDIVLATSLSVVIKIVFSTVVSVCWCMGVFITLGVCVCMCDCVVFNFFCIYLSCLSGCILCEKN